MNTPLVSVLMTVYNREKYIAEAIESVIASTYQNWELIIVDDQSKDRSVEIAREYEKKDNRIKLYINEVNLGDYPNRNRAASHAKGKYLKYLDADDMIYKYTLNYMVEAMENEESAALGLSVNIIDGNVPYPEISDCKDTYSVEYIGKSILGCGPSASIIRRDIFDSIGGFSGKKYIGDHELWLKIASKYPIIKLQPSLIWWRQHPEQQIANERKDFSVKLERLFLSLDALNDNMHLFSSSELAFAQKRLKNNFARGIMKSLLFNFDFKQFKYMYRYSGISLVEFIKSLKGYI